MKTRHNTAFAKMLRLLLLLVTFSAASALSTPALADYWGHGHNGYHRDWHNHDWRNHGGWRNDGYRPYYPPNYGYGYGYRPAPNYNYPPQYYYPQRNYPPYYAPSCGWGDTSICTSVFTGIGYIQVCD